MRVLVTGGAGFIGSNFVRRTLEKRPEVEIVVLDALTYAGDLANLEGLKGQFQFHEGTILDTDLLDSLVSHVDLVVHFAAETHNDNSLKFAKPFIETNVMVEKLTHIFLAAGMRFITTFSELGFSIGTPVPNFKATRGLQLLLVRDFSYQQSNELFQRSSINSLD